MANGITRLYKAIWYTQVGRALEQADRDLESPEVVHRTYEGRNQQRARKYLTL